MTKKHLKVDIHATDRSAGAFSSLNKRAKRFSEQFDAQHNRGVNRFLSGYSMGLPLSGTAAVLGSGAIGYGFTKALQSSFSFEDALAKVKALGDYQGPQMKKIKDQADMLGGKTRYTATEVANTHLVLTKAGVKLKEMLALLPSVLNLATLSDVEPQQAATLLTGITGSYNIPADQYAATADKLAKTVTSGKLSFEDLGLSFEYMGGLAADAKVNLDDLLATVLCSQNST